MKRNWIILLAIPLLLLAFGQAKALTVTAVASPTVGTDSIHADTTFTITIFWNNGADNIAGRSGFSMPFTFFSSDGKVQNIVHVQRTGSVSDSLFDIDSEGVFGVFYPDHSITIALPLARTWNAFSQVTGFSWDGVLPDVINYTGITTGSWPNTVGDFPVMKMDFKISDTGMFCIDSTPPANPIYEWLFDDPVPSFGGPFCWHIFKVQSDVKDLDNAKLPTEFELSQNFPNPFNPTTVIQFAVPQAGHVNLAVYNLLGQKVKTLVNEDLTAGYKQVTWDGTNEAGGQIASGVYFYKMDAGKFQSTKKLMLLK